MGFVPSGRWRPVASDSAVLRRAGLTRQQRDLLLRRMRAADLAAMVRHPDGSIRAVWAGVADNEAGVIFPAAGARRPQAGTRLPGGGTLESAREIAPGAFFYTSS